MVQIKSYSNGSYSYYSEQQKRHINIPAELAKAILAERQDRLDDIHKLQKLLDKYAEISK